MIPPLYPHHPPPFDSPVIIYQNIVKDESVNNVLVFNACVHVMIL